MIRSNGGLYFLPWAFEESDTMIKIKDDIFADDLMLFLKTGRWKVGIIADTHIGFIRNLNKRGILIEDNQADELIGSIGQSVKILTGKNLGNERKLDLFIIDGDFFHEFSKIDDWVMESARKVIRFILTFSRELIIIKGNHDKIIRELFNDLAKGLPVRLEDSVEINGFLVCHGDRIIEPETKIHTTIIGHEHPAIRLYSKTRYEEFKAFLSGKDMIVLPSANRMIEGHDILRERCISPYLSGLEAGEFMDLEVYLSTGSSTGNAGKKKDNVTLAYFHRISDILKTQPKDYPDHPAESMRTHKMRTHKKT